jgi:hypothetical protein
MAHRAFLADRAAAVTAGTTIKAALLCMAVAFVGLVVLCVVVVTRYANLEPLVLLPNGLGGVEARTYAAASTLDLQNPAVQSVIRYHLKEFWENYESRDRTTLSRDYPKALPYLKTYMTGRLDPRDTQLVLDTFRTSPNAPDQAVAVKNVVLSELQTPPFKAGITFERRTMFPGTRQPKGDPQVVAAQLTFELIAAAPAWIRDANPLAIAVTDLRIAEPFQ